MTALAGLWQFDGPSDVESDCARVLASQGPFRPVASRFWLDSNLALGHQLVPLLPEDSCDHQPLYGGGGRFVLIADLRLDNRDELTRLLQISPDTASHSSDAAILLTAIEKWGENCVKRLIGDFAFALWDASQKKLVLVRDPLGQRPLYYHRGEKLFAFASMPKGLHALATIPYELDEDCIAESFFSMSSAETRTYYRGIERVLPGHVVTVTKDGLSTRRYWEPSDRQLKLKNTEEYCEGLCEVLDQAVSSRLRGAHDTVGAELSGGLDSSAVAATAARLLRPSGGRVLAFTAVPRVGYDCPAPFGRFADEGPYAAATAELYQNMEHVLIRSGGKSLIDLLDREFFYSGGAMSGLCNAAWGTELFNTARERGLTVLLNGMCGNLNFSYHGMERLGELFGSGQWLQLWHEATALTKRKKLRWRGVLAQILGPWCPMPAWDLLNRIAYGRGPDPSGWTPINPKRIADLNLVRRARNQGLVRLRPWKNGRDLRLHLIRRYDPGASNKAILASWGIDRRDPTSDLRLLEFCLSVPTEQFLRNGVTRALARNALSDRLPKIVVDEERRGLQAADWHETLTADRERIADELERLNSCPAAVRLLDMPRLLELVKNWPIEGWDEAEIIQSYRITLAAAISTGHFVRRVTGSNC